MLVVNYFQFTNKSFDVLNIIHFTADTGKICNTLSTFFINNTFYQIKTNKFFINLFIF